MRYIFVVLWILKTKYAVKNINSYLIYITIDDNKTWIIILVHFLILKFYRIIEYKKCTKNMQSKKYII